mmetsp:Transcript_8331/g.18660  ORF Transcript_8331/g.18660 Transcript_8331/m.18660 type:complete len:218 (-) Transcript_8331:510-1163(-)
MDECVDLANKRILVEGTVERYGRELSLSSVALRINMATGWKRCHHRNSLQIVTMVTVVVARLIRKPISGLQTDPAGLGVQTTSFSPSLVESGEGVLPGVEVPEVVGVQGVDVLIKVRAASFVHIAGFSKLLEAVNHDTKEIVEDSIVVLPRLRPVPLCELGDGLLSRPVLRRELQELWTELHEHIQWKVVGVSRTQPHVRIIYVDGVSQDVFHQVST